MPLFGFLLGALLWLAPPVTPPARGALSVQVQVARQFLLAVLRADYPAAYQLLAPEVAQAVPLARFQAAAEPLYRAGQDCEPGFELYKFGLRLGEGEAVRRFYAFTFKADTLQAGPHLQLDVTFRDSAATRVLAFGLLPIRPVPPAVR